MKWDPRCEGFWTASGSEEAQVKDAGSFCLFHCLLRTALPPLSLLCCITRALSLLSLCLSLRLPLLLFRSFLNAGGEG